MEYTGLFPLGLQDEVIYDVEERYTAMHIGSGSLRVLATPAMIGFMERTAHSLLARQLPEGFSTVGVSVEVRHLAPTPLNARVRVSARVVAVEGRRVTLAVEAWDEHEKVGEGRHERAVIDLARFLDRVEQKSRPVE